MFSQLRWYVPCAKKNFIQGHIYKVFETHLWLFLFLIFILSALITVLINKLASEETNSSKSTSYTLYCIWAVITSVSVPEMPKTMTRRIIFFMWVFYSLVMSTIFLSFFTSFLIQSGLEKEISNIAELLQSNLTVYLTLDMFIFLHETLMNHGKLPKNLSLKINNSTVENPIETFCRIDQSTIHVSDLDMTLNLKEYYQKALKPCSFPFYTYSMNLISFESKSAYYEPYNAKVLQYFEGGLLQHLATTFNSPCAVPFNVTETLIEKLRFDGVENDEFFVLNLEHVKYVFILFVCGNLISVIVFMAEIIFFKVNKK
ncbi:hypothetical protein L9F63_016683 [Diploptera punctata]|uniref:Ionotropic glutamate receptor C-terminal domain-containing protein n=1 Tax=Diploptera punctata TaxID=6984 RepID=A0AAD8A0B6_DIPPU|nr:hypothetical protein L9F63_016683 [Diploptera punctata]